MEVTIHAWVVHRDAALYDPDANAFEPERWLNSDVSTVKQFNKYDITFEYGNRARLGEGYGVYGVV